MPTDRNQPTPALRRPSRLSAIRESLAPLDMIGLPAALLRARGSDAKPPKSLPIIALPGLGAGDGTMAPLRYILNQRGHRAEGWGLGINTGGRGGGAKIADLSAGWVVDRSHPDNGEAEVPALCDRMTERVRQRSGELGEPIVLIGWSLGGYVAREVARDLPHQVSAVITLAAPAVGGPKYSTVAGIYRRRDVDLEWVEAEILKRFDVPITQPITAIYSKRDGVVGWQASIDHWSPNVRHIEVNVSHIAAGLNRQVVDIIVETLDDLAKN